MACLSHVMGLFLECDILQGREGMHRNRVDRMFCDPRPDASQTPQVHNWGEHDTLNSELLDTVQQGLTCRMVPLARLLFEELIEIGIATVSIGALRIHKSLGTRGGIARRTNRRHKQPSEFFVAPGGEKCCPL